ncbi:spectrin beta chain, non-erythrocytic 4 isoform X2 [Oryctolagus cuniculus]|uniref:spectrin beta chain, non-erythrocytic 4 isoform X2 n=1 Tax=Oryctolagus cuniculus TaxID=9986 RepID=UPI00387A7305
MAQVPGEVDNMEGLPASNNNNPAARWDSPDRGWEREPPAASTAAASLFECSRIKALADEREAVQKKTFTKWVNSHLARVGCHIGDLYTDLRDGFVLTRLLEVLSGEQLPRPTRGRMRIHSLENVDKALQFLKEQRVHLENVGSHDIVDGNHRLTLGLVWTIILRFQIQVIKIETEDNRETRSAKDALLLWCQMKTAGYPEVNIQNFTTSWRDGLAFNALIHRHRPDLVDFSKLTKSNANYNLQRAFRTAEQHLGLARLLDPEDVNMEAPDEKSIITYVVSFYHYFSKMKALAVEGKRIGKVLDQVLEVGEIIERYEELAAELLAWIHRTVGLISNQKFANSLSGVQQQLQAFTAYCTLEKPVKFQEKGNLEVLLFSIQSKLRACNRRLFVPREGCGIWDIDKAWGQLEKAEHEREAALRAELIRQEKLELLAQRFDHKVAMRESWLNENQRLVSQDNFGYELPAVEAAMKKHEAIEADIAAYEERVQGVAELAQALAAEGYYDARRVAAQRDSVLRQWALLTGLVGARRTRLEQNLALQKVFQEMVYMVDWMEEMQAQLLSRECGQHLVEAEDLLQKHGLLEGDITAQSERVEALNAAALRFSQLQGYQPCDPQVICNRVNHVHGCLAELQEQAARRRAELEASRSLWALLQELEEAESWARDKERLLEAAGGGAAGGAHDLSSTARLLAQHKILQGELGGRRALLQQALRRGEELAAAGGAVGPGAEMVHLAGLAERAASARRRWQRLEEAAQRRERRLQEARALHQFGAELDGLLDWLRDAYRLAAAGDFGHDEASSRRLARQHRALTGEVEAHRGPVGGLRRQLATLGGASGAGPLVVALQVRVVEAEQLFAEVTEMAALRRQWLRDALAVYRMFGEVHACELWIGEKEQWLLAMRVPDSLDDVEVVQHRFESLDQEMNSLMGRVLDVNHTVQELVEGGHPSSEEVRSCQDHLNSRWNRIVELVEQRKEEMSAVLLVENHVLEVAEVRSQELALSGVELPGTVEAVEEALKRHRDLLTTMELNQQKLQVAVQAAEGLLRQGNAYGEQAQEAAARLLEKNQENQLRAQHWMQKLHDQLELQHFLRDCHELDGWIHEKMLMARDGTREDSHKLHKRWLRHQAFMAELAQNKEWLEKIEREGQQLMQEKPELAASVRKKLGEIRQCWAELESTTQAKARQLFEASKADQLVQSFAELDKKLLHMESQLQDVDPGGDLATVNSQLKKLQSMESQVEEWYREVGELQAQTAALPLEPASKELVGERQNAVGERLVRLLEPLQERRRLLLASKELHQVAHDLDDELAWVQERLPLAMQTERGSGLQAVQQHIKKNQGLRREIQAHGPRLEEVLERAGALASLRSPEAEAVRRGLEQLQGAWGGLREAAERRQQALDAAFQVEQYYFDVAEVEAWLGEQELLMMSEDKGKDEQSTLQLLKKHLQLEQGVENYEESIAQLSRQCRALLEMGHPDSEQISRRQSQVDRLYVALKELGEERRVGLEQQYWLYQLSRQVDELEHWIAEKEVVAGSPELGQDFEHVSVLQEKFSEFANETGTAGRERLAAVNQMVDELIECGHTAAATMAEWKDGLNEAWAELLELMGTRAQLLAASRELHKFFSDARELQGQIEEKRRRLPRLTAPPEPRPSASSMQRNLRAFEHDLQLLVSQVRQLQEGAAQLRTVYAGEHAEAIAGREQEVLQGWQALLAACEDARLHVSSTADALRFHSQARHLLSWMDGIAGQIGAADKPRDVSSVEVLMNYHQGLKAELEARVPELTACQELGRSLLLNKSAVADEIQAQLDKLGTRKEEVSDKWDRHWEWLQQMLEVHQFAQEAVVADAWLTAQEPLLQSRELGSSVDEVEQLIRRHEAFRKAAAAWEERFSSLRRLTTIEKLKAEQSKQPPTPLLGRKFFGDPTELAAKAAPLLRPAGYDRALEPLARRASDTLSAEVRTRVGYVRQELKPERLQPRIDRLPEVAGKAETTAPPAAPEDAAETPGTPAAAEQVRPRPERQESADRAEELPRRRRPERQESVDPSEEATRRRRPERQEAAEHEAAHSLTLGRYEQMERRRERRERRLERQESSEQEMPARGDLAKGKATLADIVEQLQEKEAGPGLPAGPSLPQPRELPPGRLPNGLEPPERTPRPDRPRARDRPKPRRRPRPREGGEGGGSRRSRSAPAQGGSAPAPPPPPTHTVQHEGFLLRKRELDANRKSSNRSWVSLYCVLSKGELGFYKDAKGPASGGTHGGEPLLSLHKATSEVASDYKKKKHVFKLQTQDGSEFLLQAKDEEEMNGWLEAVAASVAEHAEIARWGQTLPTTSSTDEGNPKREGGERRASGRRK